MSFKAAPENIYDNRKKSPHNCIDTIKVIARKYRNIKTIFRWIFYPNVIDGLIYKTTNLFVFAFITVNRHHQAFTFRTYILPAFHRRIKCKI